MTNDTTPAAFLPDLNACAEHVDGETLSAWRDAQLPSIEAWRLGVHIPDCPACQARLALYAAVAQALQGQRELEPGERIVGVVRAHAEAMRRRTAPASTHPNRTTGRRLPAFWRSLASGASKETMGVGRTRRGGRAWKLVSVLAPVAAVLLLFVYVFAVFGPARGGPQYAPILAQHQRQTAPAQPTAAHTVASSSQTQTAGPQQQIPIPSTFAPIRTTTQAWHGAGETASFTTALGASHAFLVGGVTPDGSGLAGAYVTLASDGTISATDQAQAGMLDVATRQFTAMGLAQQEPYLGCCTADGRFLFASDYNQPQETCGVCHLQYWADDTQKRTLRLVATGQKYQELLGGALDHGLLVFNSNLGLYVANLVTGVVTPLPGMPANAQTWLDGYNWPYVAYSYEPANASSNTPPVTEVHNLATGVDTQLPQLAPVCQTGGDNIAISGDTLFCTVFYQDTNPASSNAGSGQTVLYELDHFLDPSAQPHAIAKYAGFLPLTGANARLVAFGQVVWDRVERCFVTDDPTASRPSAIMALAGDYLAVATPQNATSAVQTVAIYDTTKLPAA